MKTDAVEPSYFFRRFHDMPTIEQKAIGLASGRVLDVGAGVGSHSLILQQKGCQVTALEQSAICCHIMKERGVDTIVNVDFFLHDATNRYDTLLLLMNGTGIAGTLKQLDHFFEKCKSLLNPQGQILIDSSDLIFLYQDEDGIASIDLNANKYYGETIFQTEYKSEIGESFPWLYVGADLLNSYC